MKTLVDEQEVQSSSPVTPQNARAPQARIQSQIKAEAKTPVAQPQVDGYESCLDLALYFLRAGDVRHKGCDQIYTTVVRDGKPKIPDDWKKLPHWSCLKFAQKRPGSAARPYLQT